MTQPQLRYVGLTTGIADGRGPCLQVATPGGLIRDVKLDRTQLISLIERAAAALQVIDRDERRALRDLPN